MKKYLLILFVILAFQDANAQPFKFAFVSDTHISTPGAGPDEDLIRTVTDINSQNDLDFVVITGDITEMGTDQELALAKQILSKLKIPLYIVPGNHDTGWSESGGVSFIKEFGSDKFVFEHKGYKFIGCASGPYVRMSDGHIPRDATVWLDSILKNTPKDQKLIFVNHYPIDNSLDNWFEVTDRLKKHNTQFAICGHGHSNVAKNFEGIPATMGRSNLRAKAEVGGYNIVEMRADSAVFSERNPLTGAMRQWRKIELKYRDYTGSAPGPRPDFKVNAEFPNVQERWTYHSDANVTATPAVTKEHVILGNSVGKVEALTKTNGKLSWTFNTAAGIFSSPAVYKDKLVVTSGDGGIYCLNAKNGTLLWKVQTGASVLGTPVIEGGVVYTGGSDHQFRAINLETGKELWAFNGIEGTIVGQPLLTKSSVVFGAWDTNLYALNKVNGQLQWKWNNGHSNRMFSPAMVTPVEKDGRVFIAAPDRYMTAIDLKTGKTIWRTKEATVRESIGLSKNGKLIYGKTMNDEVVAYETNSTDGKISWKMNAGYGYEHVPSMLIQKGNAVMFGTKNGVVYSIDPKSKQVLWKHKIDNSMVNTVNAISANELVASTMDGKVQYLIVK